MNGVQRITGFTSPGLRLRPVHGPKGSNYGDQFMTCPMCGDLAECEAVDVGVGLVLRGDYSCSCGWTIDGYEQPSLTLDDLQARSLPVEAYGDLL